MTGRRDFSLAGKESQWPCHFQGRHVDDHIRLARTRNLLQVRQAQWPESQNEVLSLEARLGSSQLPTTPHGDSTMKHEEQPTPHMDGLTPTRD
jgi:hypothetical protein